MSPLLITNKNNALFSSLINSETKPLVTTVNKQ
jgi:hypothetical protein